MTSSPDAPPLRGLVASLVDDRAAVSLEAIRDALRRGDPHDATARAFARVIGGQPLPAEEVAALAPALNSVMLMLYLAAVAEGDVAGALLDAVAHDRFPLTPMGADLVAGALWAAFRLGDPAVLRDRIASVARRHLRGSFSDFAAPLAVDLARNLGDRELVARTKKLAEPGDDEWVDLAEQGIAVGPPDLLERLPADAPKVSGFTVRSGPRPGRNEPCHCGSGKKYKKCCADKDEASTVTPSPVPGLSWEEFLRAGAPTMSEDDLGELPLRDLVRLDLAKLERGGLVAVLRRAIELRRWDLATWAAEQLGDDGFRADVVAALLDARELELAQALAATIGDRAALAAGDRLQLELATRPADALDRVERAAREALADDSGVDAIELAHGLLAASPALGVLVARGTLALDRPQDVEVVLDVVEDVRGELGLPSGDPAWDVWAALEPEEDARERPVESREAAAELAAAQARTRELERQLDSLKHKLADATAPAPAAAAAADPAERRALRERIETLEAQIREGNEERAQLRRRLGASTQRTVEHAPPPRDDEEGDAIADEPARGILIPQLSRAAIDALGELPAAVAAEAMRTIGQLCAGDRAAWAQVKQAKDLRPPLLMARIGIHHRLLFRADEGRADLLDVVTRESLMHVIKRFRRA